MLTKETLLVINRSPTEVALSTLISKQHLCMIKHICYAKLAFTSHFFQFYSLYIPSAFLQFLPVVITSLLFTEGSSAAFSTLTATPINFKHTPALFQKLKIKNFTPFYLPFTLLALKENESFF